ncbi:sigma-54-dependent Fis family transcriptional regulator [Flammeovirga sp. EKP202]|uniref:sigma-54 interaction domain-containing protein n=1 Tax=Flammeovirga sp. EKP202 TaxID=2770592 RepID=UPI00165EBEEE|nr:sigma-54 dependent transcriptional regulator [Flammeovirga sp. EKP202]MBD0401298.1 sigma-54-dependent Fis family transcriptional regulator [Flammeovirga sp. EKP202]
MNSILLSDNTNYYEILLPYLPALEVYTNVEDLNTEENVEILIIDEEVILYHLEKNLKFIKNNFQQALKYIISRKNCIQNLERYNFNEIPHYILHDENFEDRIKKYFSSININTDKNNFTFSDLIKGNSPVVQKVFQLMKKASTSKITVNITGETGTGKELVARSIHENSQRKDKKMVAVNIASIPKDLIESELFGYEQGAFTGATQQRIGKFEEAKGGTLFLDEIGELPLDLQTKLLRVLQEGELTRLGGNELIKTDVRLITATHRDLYSEVGNNTFREDLYYRILGLPVHLPPLRERKEDIEELTDNFLSIVCKENNIKPQKKLGNSALKKLLNYNFPGNIRQLKAIIDLSVVLSSNYVISASDILIEDQKNDINLLEKERTLEEYNIEIIEHFLKKYSGKVNFVADKLVMSKSKIYKWIAEGKLTKPKT